MTPLQRNATVLTFGSKHTVMSELWRAIGSPNFVFSPSLPFTGDNEIQQNPLLTQENQNRDFVDDIMRINPCCSILHSFFFSGIGPPNVYNMSHSRCFHFYEGDD
jgi:hypothetical protein